MRKRGSSCAGTERGIVMNGRYMKLASWPNTQRDTPGLFFQKVLDLVKADGRYAEAEPIIDYVLPCDYDQSEITNYMFDFQAIVNTGDNKGIYIDCGLCGEFDQSGKNYCKADTIKTLREDIDAYRIMGALSGYLVGYSDIYANSNLERFMPEKELRALRICNWVPKELLETFESLFPCHPQRTTKQWSDAMLRLAQSDFEKAKSNFASLTEAFCKVKEDYGDETAQSLYHYVWEWPLRPTDIVTAAYKLAELGTSFEDLKQFKSF